MVSNAIQFGKVFGKGYYANKGFWKSLHDGILGADANMAVKGASRIQ